MRKTKRGAALIMVLVLVVAMAMPTFAASKKDDILSAMQAAAVELGVENSEKYLNAYNSVKNYEGTITDDQYNVALKEISTIKEKIEAAGGKDVVSADSDLMNELISHVVAATKEVGVTVEYLGDGAGKVVTSSTVSSPIKQTGLNYTSTYLVLLAVVAAFGGCFAVARKNDLFA